MADEYLEVVDETNRAIGQEKRQVIHRSGLWHRGVHVFLFTPDRELLIQQRGEGQDTFPGALDCSVSEHLMVGEAYRDGAIRGLREELGIESVHLKRLLRLKMDYGPGDNMINELYEGVYERGALTINQREIARIIYHTIPELEEMMASGQVLFAPWFTQLLRWYTGKPTRLQVLWACR